MPAMHDDGCERAALMRDAAMIQANIALRARGYALLPRDAAAAALI